MTLDDVAYAMIRYSDNAATDLLLMTLGRDRVDALLAETGLTTQTPLIPLAGLMLSWQNHEQPALDDAHTAEIVAREPVVQADLAWQLAEKMASNADWRSAEIDFQINDKQSSIANEVKVANATSPAASAEEYARMMAEIATGQFISAEVSDLMHAKLSWPMRDFPENGDAFETMGTKGGTLGGVLTEASYFVPHGEQPRVVVLFQGNMPFAAWLGQLQSFSQQAFMRDLVLNPAFAAEVQETLE